MSHPPYVRLARPEDRRALFEICLKTAESGQDASTLYSDPEYPGLVWSVPYLDFAPAHCFVVDEDGTAAGYIVGTPDTVAFERRLEQRWWPAWRTKYADRKAQAALDDRVLDFIAHPRPIPADIVERYPAHLHINLLPHRQSGGWGRKLIEAELESLRQAGVAAVHLGVSPVNERAIGFYRHVGFEPIVRDGEGLWMGLRL